MRRISLWLEDFPLPVGEREGPAAIGGGRVEARPLRQANGTEALHRVRDMRKRATVKEAILWQALRGRRLMGAKFRRQRWVGAYIADVACVEAKLVLEFDGGQHADRASYDAERDYRLGAAGWRVLRFWNGDLVDNRDGVLEAVRVALLASSPSHASRGPIPLPPGEG